MFGLFFVQDHRLSLFILGAYVKRCPKCEHISLQKLM